MATATSTGTSTYAQLTTEHRLFYELQMLERAVPNFLHLFFGLEGSVHNPLSLPENQGHQIQWNKLHSFAPVTTPLAEGVNGSPMDITVSTVTGTVKEYGAFIQYTKTLVQFGIHKIAAEAADALGEQAGDSMDLVTRATLVAETTNVQFANGKASTALIVSSDVLTFIEIMKAVTTLRTNKAVGAMNGNFPAILHPKAVYDMFQDTTFQTVLKYAQNRGDGNSYFRGHIGTAFGVDFYESSNGYYASNGTVDVYSTMLFGKGAFGVGGLAAYIPSIISEEAEKPTHTFEKVRPIRLIDKPFGSSGINDPFERLATMAWYTTYIAQVLNATFYSRIEHAVLLG